MDNDQLPDNDNVSRHCKGSLLNEDGEATSAAFKLRLDQNENYLSVNWLEYFGSADIENRIKELRKEMASCERRVTSTHKLALINVGYAKKYISNETDDNRILDIKHKPNGKNQSHSGIYNMEPDSDSIAELLAETVFSMTNAKE